MEDKNNIKIDNNLIKATAGLNIALEVLIKMNKDDKSLLKDVLTKYDLSGFALQQSNNTSDLTKELDRLFKNGAVEKAINSLLKQVPSNSLTENYEMKAKKCSTYEEEYQVYLEYRKRYNAIVANVANNLKIATLQAFTTIDLFSFDNIELANNAKFVLQGFLKLLLLQIDDFPSISDEIESEIARLKEDIRDKRKKYSEDATILKSFDYMLTTESPTKTTRIIFALIANGIILDKSGNKIPIEQAKRVTKDFIIAFNGTDHAYTKTFMHKLDDLKKEYIFDWVPEQKTKFVKKSNKEYTTNILDFIELNEALFESFNSLMKKK